MEFDSKRIDVTIIVPVYNMEKLMRKCLDSILAQSFQNYECLMIDDGSTDGSPAICDEYAAKDKRFKVFHKPNGGLSDARNFGLKQAQGEYSIFADPDDWLDSEGLDKLWAFAKQDDLDVAMCDIWVNDEFGQKCRKCKPSESQEKLQGQLLVGSVPSFTVNKLIRTSLYEKYHVKYPVGIYGCEDQYTMCSLFMHPLRYDYLPIAFYHYMQYGQATLSSYYDEKTYELDKRVRSMFVELYKETAYKEVAFKRRTSYMFGRAFMFGKKTFNSKQFVEAFGKYEDIIFSVHRKRIYRFCYWLSFRGYYQFARSLFDFLFGMNKMIKRFI